MTPFCEPLSRAECLVGAVFYGDPYEAVKTPQNPAQEP